ncbi:hypothetical protein DFH09DRAFT_1291364 [Mycena vulgaris]|nr:hypothetical protein DFH09DRAFT_1291364 [Mycena vulgaris]
MDRRREHKVVLSWANIGNEANTSVRFVRVAQALAGTRGRLHPAALDLYRQIKHSPLSPSFLPPPASLGRVASGTWRIHRFTHGFTSDCNAGGFTSDAIRRIMLGGICTPIKCRQMSLATLSRPLDSGPIHLPPSKHVFLSAFIFNTEEASENGPNLKRAFVSREGGSETCEHHFFIADAARLSGLSSLSTSSSPFQEFVGSFCSPGLGGSSATIFAVVRPENPSLFSGEAPLSVQCSSANHAILICQQWDFFWELGALVYEVINLRFPMAPVAEFRLQSLVWGGGQQLATFRPQHVILKQAIRVSYLSPPKFGISLVNWLTGARAVIVLHNGCAARGGIKGLKTREYPAAVSSRRTPNTSRTRGVHVAVRRAEVLMPPGGAIARWHALGSDTLGAPGAAECGGVRLHVGHIGSVGGGHEQGRGGSAWWWRMKENDCLDSKHEPARLLSPNRGKEQIGHANCPFWRHVMGAKSQKLWPTSLLFGLVELPSKRNSLRGQISMYLGGSRLKLFVNSALERKELSSVFWVKVGRTGLAGKNSAAAILPTDLLMIDE